MSGRSAGRRTFAAALIAAGALVLTACVDLPLAPTPSAIPTLAPTPTGRPAPSAEASTPTS